MKGGYRIGTCETKGDVAYAAHKGLVNEYCMYGSEINCKGGFVSLSELSSGIIFKTGSGRGKAGPRRYSGYINQSTIESILRLCERLCEVVHRDVNAPILFSELPNVGHSSIPRFFGSVIHLC